MWLDRLTGRPAALLEHVEPGRYWAEWPVQGFNGHARPLQGVLVSDGSDVCQIGSATHCFLLPDRLLESRIELFFQTLEALDCSLRVRELQSPLMPAAVINDQSHLLPFEERLLEVVEKGHLHSISTRPRLDLHYEDEVADVSRAKRLAKGALVHLASHSECWQRQTLSGVVPKKVMARFSEDDYNIYENRVYARLLDKIERHLTRRIGLLDQLENTLSQALELYEATDLDHRLRRDICRLWGQTFDEAATSKASSLLKETLRVLRLLLKTVSGLKQGGLYRLVHRNAQVTGGLHKTNILSHDAHYRHLAVLWDELDKVRLIERSTPAERLQRNQSLAQAYSDFAGLVLRHALEPYMAGRGEAVWAGRALLLKQENLEWKLISTVPDADFIQDETLLTVVPWLSFLDAPQELSGPKSAVATGARVVALPQLAENTNERAWVGSTIMLSPLDLYCVERFGRLVDHAVYQHVLACYGTPITKIPNQALGVAAGVQALRADAQKHELLVLEELPSEVVADLEQALRAANAIRQISSLKLRQQEILALKVCPVCRSPVRFISQGAAGFRLSCTAGCSERYLVRRAHGFTFEQKVGGRVDFRTLGRRGASIEA